MKYQMDKVSTLEILIYYNIILCMGNVFLLHTLLRYFTTIVYIYEYI